MGIKYSVVISTYNRADLLDKCLRALAGQNIPPENYEIIVIDDGSTDHTERILEGFSADNPAINFNHINQHNSGPARGRNVGIRLAKGDIIFFTDDDCIVPNDWITTLASIYEFFPDTAGVGGWYEYAPKMLKRSSFAQFDSISVWKGFGNGQDIQITYNNLFLKNPAGNTSNTSYRNSVLREVGGFDESISYVGRVDWELKRRIMDKGYKLVYIPYHVLHIKPINTREVIRKFFNYGRGSYHMVKKFPDLRDRYMPTAERCLNDLYGSFRNDSISIKFMLILQYIVSRMGWECQKILTRRRRSV